MRPSPSCGRMHPTEASLRSRSMSDCGRDLLIPCRHDHDGGEDTDVLVKRYFRIPFSDRITLMLR